MLFAVRRALFVFVILASCGLANATAAMAWQEGGETPAQIPAPPQTQPPSTPPQQPASAQNPTPPAAPVHTGPVIVINPAHGGTDEGARADNGLLEKNVVLIFARMLRSEFERQGFRVVMTRNDDSNPSYEDRAAIANAYRDAIFISVHVSSTGKVGTAHAYSYLYSNATGPAAVAASLGIADAQKSLVVWEEAQRPYLEISRRLAGTLQVELGQRFAGSGPISTPFAIRELRSVSAPAIAVELSSVSVSDPNMLTAMGAPLAAALVRSVQVVGPGTSISRNSTGPKTQVAGAN